MLFRIRYGEALWVKMPITFRAGLPFGASFIPASFLLSHAPIIGKVTSLILEQSSHLHNLKIYEENNYSKCLYICQHLYDLIF